MFERKPKNIYLKESNEKYLKESKKYLNEY